MRPIQAIVFDLDGTLVDSVPDIAAALNATLAERGRPVLSRAEVVELIGGGARELIARALAMEATSDPVSEALATFLSKYEAEPLARSAAYAGAHDLVGDLRRAGYKLAICTNKPERLTALVLDGLGLGASFDSVWAGAAGRPLKPDPACLEAVCADLGVAPGAAVMVGDSRADAAAAQASGVACVLVRHGYETEALENLAAEAVIDDLSGLPAVLERLNGAA